MRGREDLLASFLLAQRPARAALLAATFPAPATAQVWAGMLRWCCRAPCAWLPAQL